MYFVDVSTLTKEIDFPVTKALPQTCKPGFWHRLLGFIKYRRMFEIQEHYVIWCRKLNKFLFIPKRMWVDGASVPKIFYSLYDPTGMLLLGSYPHDVGYKYGGLFIVDETTGQVSFQIYDKATLDEMFRDMCEWENGLPIATCIAKFGLSVGGFFTWNTYRIQNRSPITDFPELF